MVGRNPGSETLYDLYVDHGWSFEEIARRYGVSRSGARKWVIAAGISPRSQGRLKGTKVSPSHRAKLAENLKKARAAMTAVSHEKRAAKQRGRVPHNKGKKWTSEERAKQMAVRRTPEHREKLSQAKRGERNGMWRGGESPTDARLKHWSWKEQRKRCYARDNWTCRDCGVKCRNGVRIQAHHVVARRDGGLDDLENLVTLCAACHRRRERQYVASR